MEPRVDYKVDDVELPIQIHESFVLWEKSGIIRLKKNTMSFYKAHSLVCKACFKICNYWQYV